MSGRAEGAVVDAVVFDCDGTLADSEPLAARSWEIVLARYGYEVTDADIAAMIGRTYAQAHADMSVRVRSLPDAETLWEQLAEVLFALFESELRPFDDAVSAVRLLAGLGVPLAVASSSLRSRLDMTLEALGLAGMFLVTVAGDEVPNGKPAPDLFLAAAEGLGVPPSRCLAIEDSAAGVASAKAAGMHTIAIRRDDDAMPPTTAVPSAMPSLADADAVVERLDGVAIARMAGRPANRAQAR